MSYKNPVISQGRFIKMEMHLRKPFSLNGKSVHFPWIGSQAGPGGWMPPPGSNLFLGFG